MATKEQRQKELLRLQKKYGCVQASRLVQAATPAKAPLHDDFEWDDKKAGHQHRLAQARRIIRITVIRDDKGVEQQFVHVPVEQLDTPSATVTEKEGVYRPIATVVQDKSDYEKCLRELVTQRNAMDKTIKALQRAAKREGIALILVDQLSQELSIVKSTLRLMLKEAA